MQWNQLFSHWWAQDPLSDLQQPGVDQSHLILLLQVGGEHVAVLDLRRLEQVRNLVPQHGARQHLGGACRRKSTHQAEGKLSMSTFDQNPSSL